MPTPKAGYFLKDGTKVPGTTTICGAYKDAGGLIHWAWQQGKQGLNYLETRDKAGTLGTSVHSQIEDRLNKDGRLLWPGLDHITVIEQEIQLVSEVERYGGTIDAVGVDGEGRYVLLDWKTSKGLYPNYQMQLAAYKNIWNENCPGREITGGAYIVHFTKAGEFLQALPYGVPSVPGCPTLDNSWEQFIDAKRMWNRDFEFNVNGKVVPGKLGQDLERAKGYA
jgi:hypothetical protein